MASETATPPVLQSTSLQELAGGSSAFGAWILTIDDVSEELKDNVFLADLAMGYALDEAFARQCDRRFFSDSYTDRLAQWGLDADIPIWPHPLRRTRWWARQILQCWWRTVR